MIKTLLDKKYALPYRVVDALVDHFMGFRTEGRVLPVIWHLCLLTFVQRYKHDIRATVRSAQPVSHPVILNRELNMRENTFPDKSSHMCVLDLARLCKRGPGTPRHGLY